MCGGRRQNLNLIYSKFPKKIRTYIIQTLLKYRCLAFSIHFISFQSWYQARDIRACPVQRFQRIRFDSQQRHSGLSKVQHPLSHYKILLALTYTGHCGLRPRWNVPWKIRGWRYDCCSKPTDTGWNSTTSINFTLWMTYTIRRFTPGYNEGLIIPSTK
jgi:hypothetical protein